MSNIACRATKPTANTAHLAGRTVRLTLGKVRHWLTPAEARTLLSVLAACLPDADRLAGVEGSRVVLAEVHPSLKDKESPC